MGSGERRVESDEKRLVGGVWGVVSGESSTEWRVKSVWRWSVKIVWRGERVFGRSVLSVW